MKNRFLKPILLSAIASTMFLTSCSDDDSAPVDNGGVPTADRWITVAGALMQDEAGDGNGGTRVYSVSKADAKNPAITIDVYEKGFSVPSNRTARLQSTVDGKQLFNIAYTGQNGGQFSKYNVNGAGSFSPADVVVNIANYAGEAPRWAKLFDGDKTGIAVNVTAPVVNLHTDSTYLYTRGTATVLALDLQGVFISKVKQYEIALTAEEEIQGHHIFRLDSPVLNKAGNKLIIGTWMRKTNPVTGANESGFTRIGTKSVVVDYPSLENPTIISSTVDNGDTSGYRSFNAFVANDGNIYQATQRGTNGSHILKINQNNQYDNSYVFSLDTALGITGSYVDAWRYAGNGIAYVMYTYTGTEQGYVARVDLNAKTAALVDLPYEQGLDFGQYQGFVVDGDEVYIAVTTVGKDGNIYILNSKTGSVTKGATLKNKPGNHYIGVY